MAIRFDPERMAPRFALMPGVRVRSVFLPVGGLVEAGLDGCREIVVQMEPGQTGPVPYARVTYRGGRVRLYNLAHCEGVEFLDTLTDVEDEEAVCALA